MTAFAVLNPCDGSIVDSVPDQSDGDAVQAIEHAEAAFPALAAMGARERATRLNDFHARIVASAESLAKLIVLESGKPIREAATEGRYAADFVRFYAEEAIRAYGRTHPRSGGVTRLTVARPVGVVAAITPWNFPAAMVTRKVAPALAAGCPIVLKPSELTPLTAIFLHRLACDAGLGDGMFQVLTSTNADAIGRVFTGHSAIAKLSFTGSTAVGKKLYQAGANHMLRLSLELGGNAPLIVMDDANVDVAVSVTMAAKFRNAGQTCIAANRILVQQGIADRYLHALGEAIAALKIGRGDDQSTDMGPLITPGARQRVEALVDAALADDGRVVMRGNCTEGASFMAPVLMDNIAVDSPLVSGEIFGPVVPVIRFKTIEEGIRIANATRAGLAAYAVTQSFDRAVALSENLQAGIVGINEGAVSAAEMPFGGLKESGLGREGGAEGLAAFLETRYWCWGTGSASGLQASA